MAQVRWLVAVDIGGTFTDAVAFGPDGALHVAKVPSTPEDPAKAFERELEELVATGLELSATDLIFHGTTVATNARLNDRLARVVLLITEGFRDVLSYRNGTRPKVYDLEQPVLRNSCPVATGWRCANDSPARATRSSPSPRRRSNGRCRPSPNVTASPFRFSSVTSTTIMNAWSPTRSPRVPRTSR